jgi:hypothetical protein
MVRAISMSQTAQPNARRGRPRIVLAQACPQQAVPIPAEVDGWQLREAEKEYLKRKRRELDFANMRNEFPYRPARRNGDPDPGDIFYPDVQSYRRMELRKRGSAAVERLWALADSHCYYHFILNVKPTGCQLHHARRLEDVRRYIWRRISKMVTGYVRSLHLDASSYLHWDYVLALPLARETDFADILKELNRQIHGAAGPGDVRIWTKRILKRPRHIERTVDYCLRTRRFDRDPDHKWFEESFRADARGGRLGIARRRIVRCREPTIVQPDPDRSAPISSLRKPGRPLKSVGPAYRQRKRRKLAQGGSTVVTT